MDDRLRELERRFKESGAPADELAYLRERVRRGERLGWPDYLRLAALSEEAAVEYLATLELEPSRIELAACLGHAPCRRLTPAAGPPLSSRERIQAGLAALGPEAALRATLVAARAWPGLSESQLDLVRRIEQAAASDRLKELLPDPFNPLAKLQGAGHPRPEVLTALLNVVGNICLGGARAFMSRTATDALWQGPNEPDAASERKRRLTAGLERDLVPWVLGLGDPLGERDAT